MYSSVSSTGKGGGTGISGTTGAGSAYSGTTRGDHAFGSYGFEALCCCGCSVASCLMTWSAFVLLAALSCFANPLSFYVFADTYVVQHSEDDEYRSRYRRMATNKPSAISTGGEEHYKPEFSMWSPVSVAIILSSIFSGFIVAISGALVLTATCKRNRRLLKVALFFIIFTFGYFFLKDIGVGIMILTDHLDDALCKFLLILICSWSGGGPFFCYVIILVLIKRVLR